MLFLVNILDISRWRY